MFPWLSSVSITTSSVFVSVREDISFICQKISFNIAFLVRHRNYFAIRHLGFLPLHRFSRLRRSRRLCTDMKKAVYSFQNKRLVYAYICYLSLAFLPALFIFCFSISCSFTAVFLMFRSPYKHFPYQRYQTFPVF